MLPAAYAASSQAGVSSTALLRSSVSWEAQPLHCLVEYTQWDEALGAASTCFAI
jgi:hypothetical protein